MFLVSGMMNKAQMKYLVFIWGIFNELADLNSVAALFLTTRDFAIIFQFKQYNPIESL